MTEICLALSRQQPRWCSRPGYAAHGLRLSRTSSRRKASSIIALGRLMGMSLARPHAHTRKLGQLQAILFGPAWLHFRHAKAISGHPIEITGHFMRKSHKARLLFHGQLDGTRKSSSTPRPGRRAGAELGGTGRPNRVEKHSRSL